MLIGRDIDFVKQLEKSRLSQGRSDVSAGGFPLFGTLDRDPWDWAGTVFLDQLEVCGFTQGPNGGSAGGTISKKEKEERYGVKKKLQKKVKKNSNVSSVSYVPFYIKPPSRDPPHIPYNASRPASAPLKRHKRSTFRSLFHSCSFLSTDGQMVFKTDPHVLGGAQIKMPQVLKNEQELQTADEEGFFNDSWLGFPNIGLTCYMNATLQCLLSLSCFWNTIKDRQTRQTSLNTDLHSCLTTLQKSRLISNKREKKTELLQEVQTIISSRSNTFMHFKEQDAHEFLMLCLEQLKEEGASPRFSSLPPVCPVASFEFKLKFARTCTGCGRQRSGIEDFNHLSINLSSSLKSSIQLYFKPKNIEFSCCCGQCSSMSEVKEFSTFPNVLILQVMRFCTPNYNQKLCDPMDIHATLDLRDFSGAFLQDHCELEQTHDSPHCSNETLATILEQPATMENEESQGQTGQEFAECPSGTYSLHGVVSHVGSSINSGHYTSYVAEDGGDDWLLFNDEFVSKTTLSDVLENSQTTAYLIFYVHSGAGEKNQVPWRTDSSGEPSQAQPECSGGS